MSKVKRGSEEKGEQPLGRGSHRALPSPCRPRVLYAERGARGEDRRKTGRKGGEKKHLTGTRDRAKPRMY